MLDRSTPPPVRPFGFHPLPAEHVEILKNGITLHTLAGGTQAVGQITILLPGGTYDLALPSLGNLAPQLYTEGAGEFSGADIADRLDFAGATYAPHSSAHYTGFSAIVLSHRLPDIIPLIGAMIEAPRFEEDAVENVRRMALARLHIEQSKVSYRASEAMRKLVYGEGHPQAHSGSEAELEAVSPEALRELQKALVKPEGIHVYLAGGFGEPTVNAVKVFLSGLQAISPESEGVRRLEPAMCPAAPQTVVCEMPGTVQTAIAAGIPAISRSHPDFIPLRMSVMALGGYFGSRLMTNIREEKGLTYHIDAYLAAIGDASAVSIQAQCNSRFTEQTVEEVRKELEQLRENPPAGAELERLKLFAMTNLVETLDSPMSISGYRQLELVTGTPADYFEAQQRIIASLTPDTIADMAARYLRPENLRIAIAGPNE